MPCIFEDPSMISHHSGVVLERSATWDRCNMMKNVQPSVWVEPWSSSVSGGMQPHPGMNAWPKDNAVLCCFYKGIKQQSAVQIPLSEQYCRIGNLPRSKNKNHLLLFRGLQWFRLKIPPGPLISSATPATSIRKNLAEEVEWMLKLEISPTPKLWDFDRQIKRFIGEKMDEKNLIPKQFSKKCGTVFF